MLAPVALLLLSCSTPFLERARDPEGLSGGVGVNGVAAVLPGFDTELITNMLVAAPTTFFRYRFGQGVSLSLQGAAIFSLDSASTFLPESLGGFGAAAVLGLKVPFARSWAAKLNGGLFASPPWTRDKLTPLASVSLLYDLGDRLTFSASAGLPMAFGAGVVIHSPIGEHVLTHFYAGAAAPCSGGLGLGFDFFHEQGPPTEY
jgi:hypothetical protein